MSKKKKEKSAKRKPVTRVGGKKPRSGSVVAKTAKTASEAPSADGKRIDGIAERLELGAQALRADVTALLAGVRKGGGDLSAKARKTLGGVAKEYRKLSKDLKKLADRKGG